MCRWFNSALGHPILQRLSAKPPELLTRSICKEASRATAFPTGPLLGNHCFRAVLLHERFRADAAGTVHGQSHAVMPFDITKTVHVFTMTESGGIERVIVKDKRDREQVMLIQQHLRKEAARFGEGDYSDPASLHGADARAG